MAAFQKKNLRYRRGFPKLKPVNQKEPLLMTLTKAHIVKNNSI